MLASKMGRKAPDGAAKAPNDGGMEREVAEREAASAGLPRRKAHGTGTPGAHGAEEAGRDWEQSAPVLPKAPLDDGRRSALRERFAASAQVPAGVPPEVAVSARTSAAETALRAYEDEWDRRLARGR